MRERERERERDLTSNVTCAKGFPKVMSSLPATGEGRSSSELSSLLLDEDELDTDTLLLVINS